MSHTDKEPNDIEGTIKTQGWFLLTWASIKKNKNKKSNLNMLTTKISSFIKVKKYYLTSQNQPIYLNLCQQANFKSVKSCRNSSLSKVIHS